MDKGGISWATALRPNDPRRSDPLRRHGKALLHVIAGSFLGLFAGLGLPPFDLWWAAPLAFLFLFALLLDQTKTIALTVSLFFNLAYAMATLHWLFAAIATAGDVPLWSATSLLPATLAIGIRTAVFWVPVLIAARLSPSPRITALWAACCFAPLWAVSEWIATWAFFGGAPLGFVGATQLDGPMQVFIPVVGVMGTSGLVIAGAALLARLIAARRPVPVAPVAGFVALVLGLLTLARIPWTQETGAQTRVFAVRAGFDVTQDRPVGIVVDQAARAYADSAPDVDLVLLPETAFKPTFDAAQRAAIEHPIREMFGGTALVTGYNLKDDHGTWNAVGPLGAAPPTYRKQQLVPIFEYTPLPSLATWLPLLASRRQTYDFGPRDQPPLSVTGARIGVLICWEAAYPQLGTAAARDADFLFVASSDSWASTDTGRARMLRMGQLRALETGRSVVRSATNGTAAVIDHRGRIVAQTDHTETAVIASIPHRTGRTPFARLGQDVLALICFAIAALCLLRQRRKGPT